MGEGVFEVIRFDFSFKMAKAGSKQFLGSDAQWPESQTKSENDERKILYIEAHEIALK